MTGTSHTYQMDLAERFLVSRSEKHLQKYRGATQGLDPYFLQQYQEFLPEIERCYERAGYWHGTGRYHYQHASSSRYEGVNTERVVNVLESILEQGALTQHTDLWVKFDGQIKKTISLAPSRMHARLFAHIHLREGVWLKYVFGGTRFWMGFFIFLALWQVFIKGTKKGRGTATLALVSTKSLQHIRAWASAICRLEKYRILPLWRAYDFRSDIQENYGVLFGIAHNAVKGEGLIPFTKGLETRVEHNIKLSEVTHIEVPLENFDETKRILAARKVTLPVIPLEFGELYCSQFPLTQLVRL